MRLEGVTCPECRKAWKSRSIGPRALGLGSSGREREGEEEEEYSQVGPSRTSRSSRRANRAAEEDDQDEGTTKMIKHNPMVRMSRRTKTMKPTKPHADNQHVSNQSPTNTTEPDLTNRYHPTNSTSKTKARLKKKKRIVNRANAHVELGAASCHHLLTRRSPTWQSSQHAPALLTLFNLKSSATFPMQCSTVGFRCKKHSHTYMCGNRSDET